ncbi:hypothetical protein STEG23_031085 [Scotinomys teguina]
MARKVGQGKEEEESRARQQEEKTPACDEEKKPACYGGAHHVVEQAFFVASFLIDSHSILKGFFVLIFGQVCCDKEQFPQNPIDKLIICLPNG